MKKVLIILVFTFFQILLKSQSYYSEYAPKQLDENIFLENYYENYSNNKQQKIKKVAFLEKKLTSNFSIDTLVIKNYNEKGEPFKVINYKDNQPSEISYIEYENSIISKLESTILDLKQSYTEKYKFSYNKNNLLENTEMLSYRNDEQVPKSYTFLKKNIYDNQNRIIKKQFDNWSIEYHYNNDLLDNIKNIRFGKLSQTIDFHYNNQKKVSKIVDSFGYEMNYDYDKNGNLIKYNYQNKTKEGLDRETIYVFDKNNFLKESTHKENSGIANVFIDYNENNTLKKVSVKSKNNFIVVIPYNYSNNGKEILNFTREYYYDKNNSLSEIKHYLDDELQKEIIFKIEYYP